MALALETEKAKRQVVALLAEFQQAITELPAHTPIGTRAGPCGKFRDLESKIDATEGPYHILNRTLDTVLQAPPSDVAKLVCRGDKGIAVIHATMARFVELPDIADVKFGGAGTLHLFADRVRSFIKLVDDV